MKTKQDTIKKFLKVVEQEERNDPASGHVLRAFLQDIARDLLTVEQYEKIFNVELVEH